LHQRAFFSFPRFQPPRASGRGVARSEDHLNAIHKYSRLRHRTADRELRTTVLMSALSFSFEYAALTPCRKSVPFGTFLRIVRLWSINLSLPALLSSLEPQIPLKTASYTACFWYLHAVCGSFTLEAAEYAGHWENTVNRFTNGFSFVAWVGRKVTNVRFQRQGRGAFCPSQWRS